MTKETTSEKTIHVGVKSTPLDLRSKQINETRCWLAGLTIGYETEISANYTEYSELKFCATCGEH